MRESDKLKRIVKATLLQQVESHLLKVALIRLNSELKANNVDARIVMIVHDAIWIECFEKEADQVRVLIDAIMTSAHRLRVPLPVDIEQEYFSFC